MCPRRDCLFTAPRELLAAFCVMTSPQRAMTFVKSDDVLNSFKGTPRRPRCSLREFEAK
jgi:hypothetical protein